MNKHPKIRTLATFLMACALFAPALVLAASFDSGSTGAHGPLNVTSNLTLDLPADGVFHFTTVTVAAGRTLTFNNNPLNTPVHLLATGDVVVAGTISVNGNGPIGSEGGSGGPGGFQGGNGGFALNTTAGDGCGPGGGKGSGGLGSFGTNYANALLVPLAGGSGGAGVNGSPGRGGAGGGGAITIASSTKITISGTVFARGGDAADDCEIGSFGAGSGGAIRLVAPAIDGAGDLDTRGGLYHGRDGSQFTCGAHRRYASSGRVRLDCENRSAFKNLNYVGATTRGSQMFVFPLAGIPRLDITHVAGNDIPEGTGQLVAIELPLGSSTNQIVRVQGRNFTNDIPIQVVVTPENGPSRTFTANLVLASGNPPTVDINVTLPIGAVNRIHAWSR